MIGMKFRYMPIVYEKETNVLNKFVMIALIEHNVGSTSHGRIITILCKSYSHVTFSVWIHRNEHGLALKWEWFKLTYILKPWLWL